MDDDRFEFVSPALAGTSQQAFAAMLAGSEHALPVTNFGAYASECYDMISASMADDAPGERMPEFITFAPNGSNPWDELDAMDMNVRLPARFRKHRRYTVWRSPRAKATLAARSQRVKQ